MTGVSEDAVSPFPPGAKAPDSISGKNRTG
jgi:hypothetical protein